MAGRDSSRALDLTTGLVAIATVVLTAVSFQFVGSDLRWLFGVSGVAFYLAGSGRPGRPGSAAWVQGLVVSLPGLLGDVALIANNGLHRLDIPIGITLTSIASAIAGVATRRAARLAPLRAIALAAGFAVVLASWVGIGLPRLLVRMSFRWDTRPAPALRFVSLDGDAVRVPDPAGRTVVLAFWATWCQPCRWELPEIERLHERFAADARVALWAVDVGWGPESPRRAREYLDRRRLVIPAAFDSGFTAQALSLHALPSIVIVDGQGRQRLTHSGYDRSEDLPRTLSAALARILSERRPAEGSGAAR